MSKHLHKVSFKKIRYSNCWEDADLLLSVLKPNEHDRILSVGSAGDNSFSLLSCAPQKVMVYDVSPIQLYLIELKKAAFQALNYSEFLEFLGFENSIQRIDCYKNCIRKHLSEEAVMYWDNKLDTLQRGVIHSGKLERFMAFFRNKLQWILVSKKLVYKFYHDPENQDWSKLIERKLNSVFVKTAFQITFNKYILGLFGRSAYFVKEVEIKASEYFFKQFEKFLARSDSHQNFYIHYISLGYFYPDLPHYARQENFEKIKSNLLKLEINQGYLEDAILKEKGISIINASNIFEYMPAEVFDKFAKALVSSATKPIRMAYWNLMVDRILSETVVEGIHPIKTQNPGLKDQLFFYKRFVAEEVKNER